MPIPEEPAGPTDVAGHVLCLFTQLHAQIRHEIAGLDDEGLNWAPDADSNTIAVIVTHVVGSEAETLRCVAGAPCRRDRQAEFALVSKSAAEVLGVLRHDDRLVAELGPAIDRHRLRARVALPTLPAGVVRSGLTWLVGNYGHAREHVGQIQLTAQLWRSRRAGAPAAAGTGTGAGGAGDPGAADATAAAAQCSSPR